MNAILNQNNSYFPLLNYIQENIPCTMATVVEVHGSTPQKRGSSAIFGKQGLLEGTIGGGAVEYQIQQKAIDAIKTKITRIYRFELNDDINGEDSVICGGGMTILLDASPDKHKNVFEKVKKSFENRIAGVLTTRVGTDNSGRTVVSRLWITKENFSEMGKNLPEDVARGIREMLENPVPRNFREVVSHTGPKTPDNYIFLESVVPLPALLIAGAGHVGKALSHLGKILGFEVTVWDDRDEFASQNNLPDADNIIAGNHEELKKFKTDRNTFIVIVTRGHKNDAEILKQFINAETCYIGMIGSKKKVAQVRAKSIEEGWATPEKWNGIHAPVGLKIGSKTVDEIAISIAAELIQVRSNLNGQNE